MLAALFLMAPVLTVDQVVARPGELNGQVIEVQGLLPRCSGMNCALWSKPGPITRDWGGHTLGIGYRASFDRRAARYVGNQVILTARFDDSCFRADMICLDRTSQLTPVGSHPLRLLETH